MKKTILIIIGLIILGAVLGSLFFPHSIKETKKEPVISKSVCDEVMKRRKLEPVKKFEGTPAKVNFLDNPPLKTFYTTVTEQAAKGPNFAGHFTFLHWGCGTDCLAYAIIDSITGNSVLPSYSVVESLDPIYDINSRLLVFNPKDDFDYLKGKKLEEIIGEKDYNRAGRGREYYELVEENDGYVWLHKLCSENILDGIYIY